MGSSRALWLLWAWLASVTASKLHEAARDGDLLRVKELVKGRADVNAADERGWRPLHIAAEQGHRNVAEFLVSEGADLGAKSNGGWQPLHVAADHGQRDVAELLVSEGADPSAKDKEGWQPLHFAAGHGHREAAEFLLSKGADPSAKDNSGLTPAAMARMRGKEELAAFLEGVAATMGWCKVGDAVRYVGPLQTLPNGDSVAYGQWGTVRAASAGRVAVFFEGNAANILCALDELSPEKPGADKVPVLDKIVPLGCTLISLVLGALLLRGCCKGKAHPVAASTAAEASEDEAPAPDGSAEAAPATAATAASAAAEALQDEAPAPDPSDPPPAAEDPPPAASAAAASAASSSAAAPAQVMASTVDRMTIGLSADALDATALKYAFVDILEQPRLNYMESMRPILDARRDPVLESGVNVLYELVRVDRAEGRFRDDPLSTDQIAAVMTYSSETPNIYRDMNSKCYNPNRTQIEPYKRFILLLLDALRRMPPYSGTQIFRGVKMDLKAQYRKGWRFAWYGFISAAKLLDVLEAPEFCGTSGPRTMFTITLSQGQARDISRYTVHEEQEVLLPPGSTFVVESTLDAGHGLTMVQLREVVSTEYIDKLND